MENRNPLPVSPDVARLPEQQLLELIHASLELSGRFILTVTGCSMAPTLHHLHDRVELLPPGVRPPKPGEIVLFRRAGGGCILHRILRREKDGFRVNGDAQNWTEWIRTEQVIAVVGRICRNGRWICCDAPWYRCYQALWRGLLPCRGVLGRIHKFVRKCR